MKRFWKNASVAARDGGHAILIDEKPVRTPHRRLLEVPTPALADAIAAEWNAVGETIDPRGMPLTGIANAAIDLVTPDPARFAATLTAYAETDLFTYRADSPASFVAAQAEAWDPLLAWARARYDVHFTLVTGVIHQPQPAATVDRLSRAVIGCDPFTLAALAPIVTIGGSLVAALALLEQAFDAVAIWQAVTFDEIWQESHWGTDDLATATREARQAEFNAAATFLAMVTEASPQS